MKQNSVTAPHILAGLVIFLPAFTGEVGWMQFADAQETIPLCQDVTENFDLSGGLARTSFNTGRLVSLDRAQVYHDRQLGAPAVRITWRVGDIAVRATRAELTDLCLPLEQVPMFYTLSFQIPEDMTLDSENSVTIAQFHTEDSNHKPPIAVRYRGWGDLDITLNHLLPKEPESTPRSLQKKPLRIRNLRRGRWHTLSVFAIWSSDSTGHLDIVFNGRHALRYEGQNNFTDQRGRGPYVKFGVYPPGGNSEALTVLHAGYSRATRPGADFLTARGVKMREARDVIVYKDGDKRIIIEDKD